jgi:hypothetical protein
MIYCDIATYHRLSLEGPAQINGQRICVPVNADAQMIPEGLGELLILAVFGLGRRRHLALAECSIYICIFMHVHIIYFYMFIYMLYVIVYIYISLCVCTYTEISILLLYIYYSCIYIYIRICYYILYTIAEVPYLQESFITIITFGDANLFHQ